jgi:hypothetical protein
MASEQLKIELTAVDKTTAAFNSIQSNMSKLGNGAMLLSRSFTAIGAALTGIGAMGAFKSLIDQADNMNDLSKKTGIAVGELSKFNQMAKMSGTDIGGVAIGLKKLSSNIVEAAGGNRELSKIFNILGVDVKNADGSIRNAGSVMLDISNIFMQMEDGALKNALAVKLFGKAGADLIPFLNEGADALNKFKETIGTDMAAESDRFNDNLVKISSNFELVGNNIAAFFLPKFNSVLESFIKFNENAPDFNKALLGMGGAYPTSLALGGAPLDQSQNALNRTPAPPLPPPIVIGSPTQKSAIQLLRESQLSQALGGKGGLDQLKEYIIKQREAIDLLALETKQVGLTAAEYNILKAEKDGMNEINKMVREHAGENTEAFRQEAEALLAEKIAMMQRNEEFKRSFEGGMVDGLKRVREEFTNVGQAVSDTWVNAFSSMEDAFVNFVKTGKLDFKSLADSIIADMARITFRQMVSGFFGGGGGGGGFNILSMFGLGGGGGSVPLPPIVTRAVGGSVSSGSPYLVGENGPELFMPSRSGSIIPDTSMSGSGGGVIVNQTINVSTGVQQTVRAEIQSLLPQISNAAKAAVIDAKRRGGSFANAFGG